MSTWRGCARPSPPTRSRWRARAGAWPTVHRRRPRPPAPSIPCPAVERASQLTASSVGVPSANWTTRLLADYLAGATGHRTGIETVREHLHRAGYVCKRPTWVLKRKAAEQPDWAGKG